MPASQIFTDKYFLRILKSFRHVEVVDRARAWASEWNAGKSPKPLFLYGTPGVGKTSLAYLIAKEFGWQLFEMNASDLRDKESLIVSQVQQQQILHCLVASV